MTDTRAIRAALLAALALAAVAAAPTTVAAQHTDGRWTPWMGCWEQVGTVSSADAGALLCFRPVAGDAGVEMISVEGTEIVGRQTVRADGRDYDTPLEGCQGRERYTFSEHLGRVFMSSEHACEGGVTRSTTGLMAFVSYEEWVDARSVTVGGEGTTWVTRYRAASPSAAEAAGLGEIAAGRAVAIQAGRSAGAVRPGVEDVIEAIGEVSPDVVEAWLVERDARMQLDADALIRMADAGVPEEVIDAAIAVSYPEHFAVAHERRDDRAYGGAMGASWGPWGYYDPFYGSLFYSPFRYGYGYGLSYGGLYGGYYGRPVYITVGRSSDSGGRVIAGQGYRSGSVSSPGSGRSTRSPTMIGGSSGSSRGSVGSSGSVGRSSGASGGTSTGRTARRRGGGGA